MASPITVFIRVRPNTAQTDNAPAAVKRRFQESLSSKPGLTNLSFPAPANLGDVERPVELGVVSDGPPVDVRFDWDDVSTDAFVHSLEWLGVTGSLTRAPYIVAIPR